MSRAAGGLLITLSAVRSAAIAVDSRGPEPPVSRIIVTVSIRDRPFDRPWVCPGGPDGELSAGTTRLSDLPRGGLFR